MLDRTILLAICLTLASPATAADTSTSVVARSLAKSYAAAETEEQQVAVAVEAINAGLICEGCDVANLDAVFGTSFRRMDPSIQRLDGFYSGSVHFGAKTKPVPAAKRAISHAGWRLTFRFGQDGKIFLYYLTNVSKLAPI